MDVGALDAFGEGVVAFGLRNGMAAVEFDAAGVEFYSFGRLGNKGPKENFFFAASTTTNYSGRRFAVYICRSVANSLGMAPVRRISLYYNAYAAFVSV